MSSVQVSPFSCILSGEGAFYKNSDYLKKTREDFAASKPLKASYRWKSEPRSVRLIKEIASIIIFPIAIYKGIHNLVGRLLIIPSARLKTAEEYRPLIDLGTDWKYKRITVVVDGVKVDAMIVGRATTLDNGRWVLASNGNCELYENKLAWNYSFKQILQEVSGNGIVFNYPGVGASGGLPSKKALVNTHRAMLSLLEDQKKGIGAKEIIGYGYSIGGGIQGEALRKHSLKKEIKYVFIKSLTFSSLEKTAAAFTKVHPLVKVIGWSLNPAKSSKELKAPEIIVQTAAVRNCEVIHESKRLTDDGVISINASLAKALLDDPQCEKSNKTFIGVNGGHTNPYEDPAFLATRVKAYLAASSTS